MLNKLKQFLTPQIECLNISENTISFRQQSINFEEDNLFEKITEFYFGNCDGIEITTEHFERFQIDLQAEQDIALPEQIKWHLANILTESPENICYDYTIFNEDNQEIIGIGAYLSKDLVSKIQGFFCEKAISLTSIRSKDGQFKFYQQKFDFLKSLAYLGRLYQTALATLCILLIIFTSSFLVSKQTLTENTQKLSQINQEIITLEKNILKARQEKKLIEQNKKIKKYNQELFSNLLELISLTPEWIRFQVLSCDQNNIILAIKCYQKETYLNKYLQILKRQKYIKEIIPLSSEHLAGYIDVELKIIRKQKTS